MVIEELIKNTESKTAIVIISIFFFMSFGEWIYDLKRLVHICRGTRLIDRAWERQEIVLFRIAVPLAVTTTTYGYIGAGMAMISFVVVDHYGRKKVAQEIKKHEG